MYVCAAPLTAKIMGGDTVTDVTFTPTARLINYPGTQTPLTGAAPHAHTGQPARSGAILSKCRKWTLGKLWVSLSISPVLFGRRDVSSASASRNVVSLGFHWFRLFQCAKKKGAPAAGLYTVANRKVLYIIFFLLLLILILLLLLFVTQILFSNKAEQAPHMKSLVLLTWFIHHVPSMLYSTRQYV